MLRRERRRGLCHALSGLNLLCDVTPWRCPGLECIALSGQGGGDSFKGGVLGETRLAVVRVIKVALAIVGKISYI